MGVQVVKTPSSSVELQFRNTQQLSAEEEDDTPWTFPRGRRGDHVHQTVLGFRPDYSDVGSARVIPIQYSSEDGSRKWRRPAGISPTARLANNADLAVAIIPYLRDKMPPDTHIKSVSPVDVDFSGRRSELQLQHARGEVGSDGGDLNIK